GGLHTAEMRAFRREVRDFIRHARANLEWAKAVCGMRYLGLAAAIGSSPAHRGSIAVSGEGGILRRSPPPPRFAWSPSPVNGGGTRRLIVSATRAKSQTPPSPAHDRRRVSSRAAVSESRGISQHPSNPDWPRCDQAFARDPTPPNRARDNSTTNKSFP